MHKCIMVKVGGKQKIHIKYVKKQVNFSKTEEQIFKVGALRGNNNFRETEGKCTKKGKIGGKFEICGRSLKKGHQKF